MLFQIIHRARKRFHWPALLLVTGLAAAPAFAAPEAEPSQLPAPPPSEAPMPEPVVPEMPDQPGQPEPPAPLAGQNAWQYLVIHHSASPSGNAASFDRMHRGKGWDGLAYHFVITNGKGGPDGGLQVSSRWWAQKHGAHAGAMPVDTPPDERNAYNEFGIGICLVGNFEHRAPSRAQMKTLAMLVTKLRGQFNIPVENVVGHRHVKSTACPGGLFPWKTLFAMTGEPQAAPPYRHSLAATYERCPWCQQRGAMALNRPRKVESSIVPPHPIGLTTP